MEIFSRIKEKAKDLKRTRQLIQEDWKKDVATGEGKFRESAITTYRRNQKKHGKDYYSRRIKEEKIGK